MNRKIILLSGPTASGKTKLAIYLAKKINGEIINADSMQVYKDFQILSSRPSKNELRLAKHHLYGFQSSGALFSTGKWLKLVKNKIDSIIKKGKVPILVGGTGLYFKAITDGISKIPNIKPSDRDRIRNLHKRIGQQKFYEKLIKLDFLSKNKILPTDTQRTLRAYEVKKYTKKSIYEWAKKTKPLFYSNLPIFKKEQVIGKATSIVWSPKFSKYIGFFIANKDVKHDLESHYILNKVKFEMYEIN